MNIRFHGGIPSRIQDFPSNHLHDFHVLILWAAKRRVAVLPQLPTMLSGPRGCIASKKMLDRPPPRTSKTRLKFDPTRRFRSKFCQLNRRVLQSSAARREWGQYRWAQYARRNGQA